MVRETVCLVAGLALAAGIAGCRVHVDKDASGQEKTVQVDTPFGGVHVNTDQTSAADLGLPVYPGAQAVADDDKHKSADVHLGFGEWELRVRAVSYATSDSKDQVVSFYKKALGRYGDVIVCQSFGRSRTSRPVMSSAAWKKPPGSKWSWFPRTASTGTPTFWTHSPGAGSAGAVAVEAVYTSPPCRTAAKDWPGQRGRGPEWVSQQRPR